MSEAQKFVDLLVQLIRTTVYDIIDATSDGDSLGTWHEEKTLVAFLEAETL